MEFLHLAVESSFPSFKFNLQRRRWSVKDGRRRFSTSTNWILMDCSPVQTSLSIRWDMDNIIFYQTQAYTIWFHFFRSLPPLSMFPFPVSRRIWAVSEILSPSLSPISSIWRRSDHLRPSADQTTHCADRNIVRINRFCWSDNTLCWSSRQRLAINCQLWSYHKVIRSDGGKWGVTTCLPQASNLTVVWPPGPDHFFLIVFLKKRRFTVCLMNFKHVKKRSCLR